MDPATLNLIAANAVALLSPYLSKAAETVVPKAADDLYTAIKKRLSDKPAAQEAMADLEKSPEDSDSQAAMRIQIKKALREDESFTQEIKGLVEQLRETGGKSWVSGRDRGVAAGRDISGTVLTGDIKGSVTIDKDNKEDDG
ncbi:MAG: hypothetical protein P8Y14_27285 [Anaerolineales bacterium]|jgi:hypothetical protein